LTATLTENFNVNNINNFLEDINSSNSSYYFFVGGTLPWPIDSVPPSPLNDFEDFDQDIFHSIVFGKLISNSNISYLIPRYNYTSNTIYTQYDPNNANLFSSSFYVLNNQYSVYKCIDNNNGSPSLIQPLITPTSGTFQTSDGYTWKFLYTISTNANTLFTSSNFIPVVPNTYVSNNSIPGTIDITRVITGGSGYQTFDQNYLGNIINQNTLKLGNTASNINNFYTGCSIYLNGGLGANQLRTITAYNGGTQVVSVSPSFNTYVNLYLGNTQGSFILGESVDQFIDEISYVYSQGYFNVNDYMIQSDSGFGGYISSVNTSVIGINQVTNSNISVVSGAYPIIDTNSLGTLQSGVVTVNTSSNVIIGGAGANLLTYSVNNYIRVGSNTSANIRRITSITNSSYANVSVPFNNTLISNVHYLVPNAFEPISSTEGISSGIISQVNLTSMIVNFGNVSSNSISFILGETVKEYNANGVDQSSNAVISYANSTTLILSSINGTISTGFNLVGQSSTLNAQILNISSYPNITLSNTSGTFISGSYIYSYYANGLPSGNAVLLSSSYSPSSLTQYIVSPTVNFSGDGYGAMAYSIVNTSIGANYPISKIVMINTGTEYTISNTYISGNPLYGSGANLYSVLSPTHGHGSNCYSELGAKYAGISVTIDTASNENYYFPNYGSYRKVGIIKNPFYNDVYLNTDNVHRYAANISLSSNNFVNNEIIYQPSTNSAALIKYANSSYLELDNINGSFVSNTSNNLANCLIIGLKSNTTANLLNYYSKSFNLTSNTQYIYSGNNPIGLLTQVLSNNQIRMTNISGKISNELNTIIYDPTVNSYANLLSIYSSNDTVNSSITYGTKFNQTSRLTISSNVGSFQIGEYVTQATTNASGLIINTSNEIDLIYTPNFGTITTGIILTDSNTSATGIITFANSSYIKMTAANGIFNNYDKISTITANGSISSVIPVIVVSDLLNEFPFQVGSYELTGNTSGAIGLIQIANTVTYPDLIRNTGEVLYLNYVSPFIISPNTKSTFNITIQL
jgi:hypothetical protein